MEAIKRAMKLIGRDAMARHFQITPQAISQWRDGYVPAERCPTIERMTQGVVRCEDLRPDVEWAVLRGPTGRDEAAHDARCLASHELQEAA